MSTEKVRTSLAMFFKGPPEFEAKEFTYENDINSVINLKTGTGTRISFYSKEKIVAEQWCKDWIQALNEALEIFLKEKENAAD